MERHYETVCIVKPDVGDDAVKSVIDKASATVEKDGGKIARVDDWGRRKLAYPISKKNEGYYFVLTCTSEPATIKEVERQLKLNEDVLRYQTVVLKELPSAAPVQTSAEAAAAKVEKPAETGDEDTSEEAPEKEGGADE